MFDVVIHEVYTDIYCVEYGDVCCKVLLYYTTSRA